MFTIERPPLYPYTKYNTDVHLVCPDGLILASLITTAAISLYNNYKLSSVRP